ncbi:branched-chain-amino-acid transaminase [Gautieria morchelliformis]|nr:branched-chain-amino-acid transaminase [Gautieria morchelliformis]
MTTTPAAVTIRNGLQSTNNAGGNSGPHTVLNDGAVPQAVTSISVTGKDDSHGCLSDIEVSRLTITHASTLKPLPRPESLTFGSTMTDHMLIMSFDPLSGWSAPAVRPYGPLNLDPASSCFQYCPNIFEGMKAYLGPDGTPLLFRPDMNMARMARSAARVALPSFNQDALLTLIKKLVMIDARWIPSLPGYSLYIRPTLIGTRPALGVIPSTHATLYVILSPTGPYFSPSLTTPRIRSWISLLASSSNVRAWPGGTGAYKLGGNYSPCFEPQREAAKQGYSQILWLLPIETEGKKEWKVTECGQMNFMCVIRRDDGGIDIVTPLLDGTILPGVTRDSIISLAANHNKSFPLPGVPSNVDVGVREDTIYMSHIVLWAQEGRLLEAFGAGTAAVLAGVWRVGWEGRDIVFGNGMQDELKDGEKDVNGLGPVGKALYDRILEIQGGRVQGHEWSVSCAD